MALNLADGQLGASSATLITGTTANEGRLAVTLFNTHTSSETVYVYLSRAGGTARQIAQAVLATKESLQISGLPLGSGDVLSAYATDASKVDYLIAGGADGPLVIQCLDANGALKSGAAAIGSGNLTISGDLAVQGGDIDAGASGVAGSVDVFPSTASKGKLAITCTAQTGDTTVSLVAGAMAAARTLTIPDPLASADFLLGQQAAVARTATSDGLTTGTIADAGMHQFITVTSADANNIIVLPTPTPGTIVLLANGATGYELRTSSPTTIAINGGTGAAAESAIAASTLVIAVCKTATAWAALSLVGTTLAAVEAAA